MDWHLLGPTIAPKQERKNPVSRAAPRKAGMLDMGEACPQGEAGNWGCSVDDSMCAVPGLGIMLRVCLYFLHRFCCTWLGEEASHLVSAFLTKRMDLGTAIESVCPQGKGGSRVSYSTLLKSLLVKLFDRCTFSLHFFSYYSLFFLPPPGFCLSISWKIALL